MKHLALTFIAVVALPSCLIMPHYETLTGKVTGRVVDATGQPVSGATIDYHLRSDRKLGSAISDSSGNFHLGPFRQWFYVVYIGSPGVCPVPYTLLSDYTLPDALKVSHDGGIAVYCLGTFESHNRQLRSVSEPNLERLSKARWTGSKTPMVLVITPSTRDRLLPRRVFHPLPTPDHTNH
ncbi:MAG: carboxypeptidase-like regulatory domain-containing protein [Prosthecobacter sp.]